MASISPTTLQCPSEPHSGKKSYLKLTITSITQTDGATNTTTVSWKITTHNAWSTLYRAYCTLGGKTLYDGKPEKSSWTDGWELKSGTTTFNNNSDGSLTLAAYLKQMFYYGNGVASRWTNPNIYQDASTNMVCSQIPRYANFTSHYVSGTGINTLSVHWDADSACDYAQYSLSGGSWKDGASWPDYTLGSLSPGTQYNVRTRIRRTDSQLWTTSSYIYGTTKSLPSSNTPGNFNLGNNVTPSISSMSYLSHWYVHLYDGSTKIKDSGALYSTSVAQGISDSNTVNGMLSRHPNDNSWPITFNYYCVSNGVTYQLTTRSCTCSIPSGSYLPSFNSNNISYVVTDSQSLNLTGSNKKVIKGISDITVTCTPASPQGYASMKSYSATSGNSSNSTTNTSSPSINLSNVTSSSVIVQAIDSRNRSTSATKNFDTFIDYFAPSINSANIVRIDGIGANLNVNITGKYCNWSGLATTNIMEQVSIQYKEKGTGSYTTISGVNLNISNNNGNFTISGIITGNYFETDKEYDLLLTFKDKITNLPYAIPIPTGKALIWRDLENNYIGIGKKPTKKLDVDGSINGSDLYINNTKMIWYE